MALAHERALEMRRRTLRKDIWRTAVLVAAFVPPAYVAVHGREPSPAEGCSGGPSQGINSLTLGGPDTLPVGRDAFFPIILSTQGVDGSTAAASVTVQVRDAANELVPGTTTLLSALSNGQVVAGWSASTALAPDANLAAFVSAPGYGGSTMLTATRALIVRDATATPAAPTLGFTQWNTITSDWGGTRVTCGFGGCGSLAFGESVTTRLDTRLEGDAPVPPIAVAWEVSVAADGASAPFPAVVTEPTARRLELSISFPATSGERCVRVTTRDLRSAASAVSDAICATPPTTTPANADSIRSCPSAPPGYEDRWCRAREVTGTPCAIGGAGGVGGGFGGTLPIGGAGTGGVVMGGAGFGGTRAGTGGVAGSVTEPGTGGQAGEDSDPGSGGSSAARGATGGTDSDDAGAPNDESERPDRVVTTEGCGCSTPGSRSNLLGALAMLIAFALRTRRRA